MKKCCFWKSTNRTFCDPTPQKQKAPLEVLFYLVRIKLLTLMLHLIVF
jgi:hypothetical protein